MNNIALLLDLDNIKPKLDVLERICQGYGKIVERRAFSNTPAVLTAYGSQFREFGYRFELTPGLNPVAQEVDNLIITTARELVENTRLNINLVAIVSNDNDYSGLMQRLRSKSIQTLVIGNQIGQRLRESSTHVEILNEVMRPSYVGIDLGTTNTVIALANINLMKNDWTASVLELPVKNEQKSEVRTSMIPSSVRLKSATEAEIGHHVRSEAYAFRDQTVLAWKHNIGKTIEGLPFQYKLSWGEVKPEDAASRLLQFCRERLLKKYGDLQGVVITHPASYEVDAIEATRKAAVMAGWKEEDIVLLSEPQAALYDFLYGVQKGETYSPIDLSQPSHILVYDLGGGTLDVTLHKVQWSKSDNRFIIQDIAIGSRTKIGGDTVDTMIADYILLNTPAYSKLPEAQQKKLLYELTIYAEKYKKLWGGEYNESQDKENFKYAFRGVFLDSQFPINYYISSEKMRQILAPLLCQDLDLTCLEHMNTETAFNEAPFIDRYNTLIVPILDVLLKAKQTLGEVPVIDTVLLNGGMTYFPCVRERLQQLLGSVPLLDEGNPDLAVARGASLYAAGALKSAEAVNPTNIYLEVEGEQESQLSLLVAQGQKFPYRTVLSGFKLPTETIGNLGFKVWVGMGTKPRNNTTLQRLRQVPIEKVIAAKLEPGCLLDLEVEYTFDERLILTLVSPVDGARFVLEVTSDKSQTNLNNRKPTYQAVDIGSLIPKIARTRQNTDSDVVNVRVDFKQWELLAQRLENNWNNSALHQQRRELVRQSISAQNRTQIISDLLRWLELEAVWTNLSSAMKVRIAVMCLSDIFKTISSDYSQIISLERKFHDWVYQKFTTGFNLISNELLFALVETPGKLFWSDFDTVLLERYKYHKQQPKSEAFLTSIGKCIRPSSTNLSMLRDILRDSTHTGQKIRAAWALGRLISFGQPDGWRTEFKEVLLTAKLVLNQLHHSQTTPQVAGQLLGCLSHCMTWHISGQELTQELSKQIKSLPSEYLPVVKKLPQYPDIAKLFDRNLELVIKLFDPNAMSLEESKEIKMFLLQAVKD